MFFVSSQSMTNPSFEIIYHFPSVILVFYFFTICFAMGKDRYLRVGRSRLGQSKETFGIRIVWWGGWVGRRVLVSFTYAPLDAPVHSFVALSIPPFSKH